MVKSLNSYGFLFFCGIFALNTSISAGMAEWTRGSSNTSSSNTGIAKWTRSSNSTVYKEKSTNSAISEKRNSQISADNIITESDVKPYVNNYKLNNNLANETATELNQPVKDLVDTDSDKSPLSNELNAFSMKSQTISREIDTSGLKQEGQLAFAIFSNALLQVGLDNISETRAPDTKEQYNQAIGCINSQRDSKLNHAATQLLNRYSSITDMKKFNTAETPTIGGNYIAQCF